MHMMTIDKYIQQKNEESLRLEIAYSNLYQAYISGNVDSMRYQYDLASQINIPFFANSIQGHTKLVMQSTIYFLRRQSLYMPFKTKIRY